MSQLLLDCQINITRLLYRVESALHNHQQKVNNTFKDTYKTIAEKITTTNKIPQCCERYDYEITLTVKKDKHGILLFPQGSQTVLQVSSTDKGNKKRYIISPIPSRKKLKLNSSKVQKKYETESKSNDESKQVEIITNQPSSTKFNSLFSSKETSEHCSKMDHPEFLPPIIDVPEKVRLDFSTLSQKELDLDPIKCEIVSEQKKSHGEDGLSSCDSGYENSDLDELSHSPRSTEHENSVWIHERRELSSLCYEDKINSPAYPLKETCSTPNYKEIGTPKMSSSVEKVILFDNIHLKCSTRRSHKDVTQWITAQSPYVGKTPLHMSAFKSSLQPMTPVVNEDENDTESHMLNVYEFDNDSYSTTASLPKCDFNNSTGAGSIYEELNNTHLHQELAQALVQEVENLSAFQAESSSSNDNYDQNEVTESQEEECTLNNPSIVLSRELSECKDELLGEIDIRRDELHKMVDKWHQWITNRIELAYEQEHNRQKGEIQRINPVQGVRSPTKTLCTFLNTKHRLNRDLFGTFTSHTSNQERQCSPQKPPQHYFMCRTKHMRTFETRDTDNTTEYMATSINTDTNGHYTVTDLGADTCRVFTSEGCLVKDLDVSPLDEPTYAFTNENNQTILACRTGLKLYQYNSIFSSKLAIADIKCPQCFAFDKVGNYIVSDMHDCGSVIVTLEKNTLLPLRMFCGTQYDSSPEAFTSAWYIYVTADNCIVLSDREDHMIKCYTQHGEYLWSTGGLGAEPGLFFTPAGITQDRLGNILVADCNNDRVQLFSQYGEWLGVVVSKDSHDVKCPMDLAIDSNDNLVVLQSSGTLSVFSYMK